MAISFSCIETERSGFQKVQFTEPTFFQTPEHWNELKEISEGKLVLVVGVFSWSNYSQKVVQEIMNNENWFKEKRVEVAMFCLGDVVQIQKICPDFVPHFLNANTEPALFLIKDGSLVQVRFGPIDFSQLIEWLTFYLSN